MNNAQAALAAAALVHQKVAAGAGSSAGGQTYRAVDGKIKIDVSSDEQVLVTATKFYNWLQEHGSDLSI